MSVVLIVDRSWDLVGTSHHQLGRSALLRQRTLYFLFLWIRGWIFLTLGFRDWDIDWLEPEKMEWGRQIHQIRVRNILPSGKLTNPPTHFWSVIYNLSSFFNTVIFILTNHQDWDNFSETMYCYSRCRFCPCFLKMTIFFSNFQLPSHSNIPLPSLDIKALYQNTPTCNLYLSLGMYDRDFYPQKRKSCL